MRSLPDNAPDRLFDVASGRRPIKVLTFVPDGDVRTHHAGRSRVYTYLLENF